jgi:hypothetical protein
MSEQSAGGAATKALGALVSAALGGLTWLAAGATGVVGLLLAGSLSVLSAIGAPVAFIIFQRYLGVLGAGGRPKGSPARLAYEELRDSLSLGNLAGRLYSRWLSVFLDAVDRFFGDAGEADQTLFPRAFGLKTPAPLWTAPAFDRCLLLALLYPIVVIVIIWAISGHVGPAEAALGLAPDIPRWLRGFFVVVMILASFLASYMCRPIRILRPSTAKEFARSVVSVVTISVAGVVIARGEVSDAVAVAVVIGVAAGVAVGLGAEGAVAGAVSGAVAAAAAVAFAGAVGAAVSFGLAAAVAFAGAVGILSALAIEYRRHGIFLLLFR